MSDQATHPRLAVTLLGSLDWILPAALVASVIGAYQGVSYLHDARWSLGALLFGGRFAVDGATYGAAAWAAWNVTRRTNVVFGIGAGVLLGVGTNGALRALYQPISKVLLRLDDGPWSAMREGVYEWIIGMQGLAFECLLVSLIFGGVAHLMRKSAPRAEAPVPPPVQP
jgi:hypothetical protein